MNPFLYEEFGNPGMEYECSECGARFGDACVGWDDEAQCHVAACPACGHQAFVEDEEEEAD